MGIFHEHCFRISEARASAGQTWGYYLWRGLNLRMVWKSILNMPWLRNLLAPGQVAPPRKGARFRPSSRRRRAPHQSWADPTRHLPTRRFPSRRSRGSRWRCCWLSRPPFRERLCSGAGHHLLLLAAAVGRHLWLCRLLTSLTRSGQFPAPPPPLLLFLTGHPIVFSLSTVLFAPPPRFTFY